MCCISLPQIFDIINDERYSLTQTQHFQHFQASTSTSLDSGYFEFLTWKQKQKWFYGEKRKCNPNPSSKWEKICCFLYMTYSFEKGNNLLDLEDDFSFSFLIAATTKILKTKKNGGWKNNNKKGSTFTKK